MGSQWGTCVKQSAQPPCAAGGPCRPPVPAPPGTTAVSFDFESSGHGCVLQTTVPVAAADAELTAFLASMKAMTAKPLSAHDATWKYLPQVRVAIAATALATAPLLLRRRPRAPCACHGVQRTNSLLPV